MKIDNYIEFYRMKNAVHSIVELVFDGGEYCPELYDYAFWVTISYYYAGIGADMEIDEFMQKLYNGWMEELKAAINQKQFIAIKNAVKERIEERKNKNPLREAVTELVQNLKTSWNPEDMEQLIDVMKKTKEINAESLVEAYINNQK